jgi:hypothetical protein
MHHHGIPIAVRQKRNEKDRTTKRQGEQEEFTRTHMCSNFPLFTKNPSCSVADPSISKYSSCEMSWTTL